MTEGNVDKAQHSAVLEGCSLLALQFLTRHALRLNMGNTAEKKAMVPPSI